MNLGLGLIKIKDHDKALDALTKCLRTNPDYLKAYIKRGEVNQALENY